MRDCWIPVFAAQKNYNEGQFTTFCSAPYSERHALFDFQLRENIQVCISLLPTLILSAVVGLVGACMLLAAFLLHVEVSVILIIGVFQCGLSVYCMACPISLIAGVQKYRMRTLALLRRRHSKVVQDDFKRPAEEQRNLHFQQLQRQWNRP